MSQPDSLEQAAPVAPERLVLYDGVCGFCDGAVQWLLARDPEGRLRFAPLQGETAAHLRRRHPELPDGAEAMAYVESGDAGERVALRWEAVLRACAALGPLPWWMAWTRWLPAPLMDIPYRIFARLRYRLFGRLEACRVPTAAERRRFLP